MDYSLVEIVERRRKGGYTGDTFVALQVSTDVALEADLVCRA
jgi:hypothetical protein